MSVVKINALTVPADRRDDLEARFGARAGMVDDAPGFERFQLLRPTDGSEQYFVVTQWASEQAFEDWMASRAFQSGHGNDSKDRSGSVDGDASDADRSSKRGPAASDASLLAFEVVAESVADQ